MEPHDPQFEDPQLKAALKRTLGAEVAPETLRQRVAAALTTEERGRRVRAWRPLAGLAAAAILLLGFGLTYTIIWRSSERPAPQWFAAAMVKTHDQHISLPDHQLLPDVPANDLPAAGTKLSGQLGHRVLSAGLGDGWTFQGAGLCQISGVNASHLMFTRGDQTISVFSVSARMLYTETKDGTSYSQVEQGHPVSGFVYDGAVHCLVGSSKSGDLDLKTVTRLRDTLRASFTAGK